MARIVDMHKKWMKEPTYRKAYEALEGEFILASAVIDVRNRAGLTQEERIGLSRYCVGEKA